MLFLNQPIDHKTVPSILFASNHILSPKKNRETNANFALSHLPSSTEETMKNVANASGSIARVHRLENILILSHVDAISSIQFTKVTTNK